MIVLLMMILMMMMSLMVVELLLILMMMMMTRLIHIGLVWTEDGLCASDDAQSGFSSLPARVVA